MVFLAEQNIPIPTKDINSWIFDDVLYDRKKPVRLLYYMELDQL